uniref:Uncharacterized protein n=1 Tax=Stomoxys calcitrans TaxID=35570 RepID=A0A1I8PPU7_STOCA
MVKNIQQFSKGIPKTPKPVHATAIRHHALLASGYVRQHMILDERWTNSDLIDVYSNMAILLKKHLIFKQLEKKTIIEGIRFKHKDLRQHVQNGRKSLRRSLGEEFEQKLHTILINDKQMQRLYVNMMPQDIEENIKQRTFTMKKEHDRLSLKLGDMKQKLEEALIRSSELQIRVRFQNEYILQEELTIRTLYTAIKNSQTRLKAIKTINTTYKKMLQVMKDEEKFFEPILNSLSKDIEDQQNFIAYVLCVGSPVLDKEKELQQNASKLEEIKRSQTTSKGQWLGEVKRGSWQRKSYFNARLPSLVVDMGRHYARETRDMVILNRLLADVEGQVKSLQEVTLSFKPKAIPSIFKQQSANNLGLRKQIALDALQEQSLADRNFSLLYQKQFLQHDFHQSFLNKENNIKQLKEKICQEDLREKEIMQWMQERGKTSVVVTCSLWNFYDVLRHVHVRREYKVKPLRYPNEYLKQPLLRYESMAMKAAPPLEFEEDALNVLKVVTQKLLKLTLAYNQLMPKNAAKNVIEDIVAKNKEAYNAHYLATAKSEHCTADIISHKDEDHSHYLPSLREETKIPTRAVIKDLSSKLVEHYVAKQE